jgi:ketosteroid isomerase-like protein
VLGFIAVLFSTDSLRVRPVGGASGFQLFTRHHARRWPLPVVLLLALLAVAYVAFRPVPPPTKTVAAAPAGVAIDAVSTPSVSPASAAVSPAAQPAQVNAASAPEQRAVPAPVIDPREEVTAAVEAWRSAWSARDVPRYLAAYAPDFQPAEATSHAAWVSQRKERLRNARGLRVQVEQLEVSAEGDRATARFLQHYRAGSLNDQVRKRLVFVRRADGWKISEEAVETAGQR